MSLVEPTPARPLHRRIGWLALGQGAERTAQIAMVIVLARVLAPAEWDVLALALTVYLVGVTVVGFNLEHSIVFFAPRIDRSSVDSLVARTFYFLLCIGTGAAFLLWAARGLVLPELTDRQTLYLAATLVLEPATVIGGALFLVECDERGAGVWDAAQSAVQFAAVALPAFAGLGVSGVLAGLAVAASVRFLSFVLVFRPSLVHVVAGPEGLVRRQLLFCLPVGLTLAAGVLAKSVDKWMVAGAYAHKVGEYAVAAQEVPLLAVLPYAGGAAVAVGLVRAISEGRVAAAHRVWVEQVEAMCAVVIPATFALVLTAPVLLTAVFGRGFSGAVVPFRIFTLVSLHRVTEYGVVLRAADRTIETVGAGALLLVGNVVLGYAGLRLGGIVGLTVGSVTAFFVSWIWTLRRIASVFGTSLSGVFPWATWSTHVAVGAAALTSSLAAGRLVADGATRTALELLVFALAIATGRQMTGSGTKVRTAEELAS